MASTSKAQLVRRSVGICNAADQSAVTMSDA